MYAFQLRANIREYKIQLIYDVTTTHAKLGSKPTTEHSSIVLEEELFRVVENRPEIETNGIYEGPYIRLMKVANLPLN